MEEETAVTSLAALAQGMRLRIFRALVGAGPQGMTPGALSAALAIPASTLSFHLKELMHAKLVTQQRDGRHLIYRPSIEQMNGLIDYLAAHCCEGAVCELATAPACANADAESIGPEAASRRTPMPDKVYNVLFICTGNSARSILAEGLMNQLGGGRFKAWSAGSHPKGAVHPMTLDTLRELRLPVDGYRSKSWKEFAAPDAPPLDFVITVCDTAGGETCPVWLGQPMTAPWGMPDPTVVEGPEDVRRMAFKDTAVALKRRIELMLALPLTRLDSLAIQREIRDIGLPP